ncbi:MAG: serine/threonine protein kinase [Candidatus Xenobia bacterium]
MHRGWFCFCLVAMLLRPLVAEESRRVTLRTWPSGARVLEVFPRGPRLVGFTGQPVSLTFFGDVCQVQIELDGYLPRTVAFNRHELPQVWPPLEQAPMRLTALSPWSDVRHGVLEHRVLLGILAGLTVIGGALWRRHRRTTRAALARAARLDALATREDPLVGRLLGKWRLLRVVAHGGGGSVYQAVADEALLNGERVAIKLIHCEDFERFSREVNILRRLQHPNIVKLLDWGQEQGRSYIVTEWIEGKPLEGEYDEEGFRQLFVPLLQATWYAHQLGVLHLDIKPENVLVDESGRPHLLDFGIARLGSAGGAASGTPGWMAPEQQIGRADARSDQYALGRLGLAMLSAEAPMVRPMLVRMTSEDPSSRFDSLKGVLSSLESPK